MKNNIYIIGLFCSLSAILLGVEAQNKPTENAAQIYQKIFDLYPSKEVKAIRQKIHTLQTNIISKKEDPNLLYEKTKEWQEAPVWKLKQKVDNYAQGKISLDAEIESYMGDQKSVLELIQQASSIKSCDWPAVPDTAQNEIEIMESITNRALGMRENFLLTMATARLDVDKARYREALAKTFNAFRIIHHTGNSTCMEHLICLAMEKVALDRLRDMLGQMPPDTATLQMIETQLEKEKDQFFSFRKCVLGEKEFFAKIISKENIMDSLERELNIDRSVIPQIADDYIKNNIEYNDHYVDQVCQVLDLPYTETLNKLERIQSRAVQDASIAFDFTTKKARPENILKTNALQTVLSNSNLSMIYTVHTGAKNRLHAMLSAAKIYQCYVLPQRLPPTLPPECPPDLFSDKPFVYEITKDGFNLRCQKMDNVMQKIEEYSFVLKKAK